MGHNVSIQELAALKREHEDARQKVIEASKAVFELSNKIDNLNIQDMDTPDTIAYFPVGRPKKGIPVEVISETPPAEGTNFSKSVLVLRFKQVPEENNPFSQWYQEWTSGERGRTFDITMSNGDVYKQCSPLGMVMHNGQINAEISYSVVQ